MPWGYRSTSSTLPSNEHQVPGATIKLDSNALEKYGLTTEDVMGSDPPIETERQVCFGGNSYVVVKCSQMEALKTRVQLQKAMLQHDLQEDMIAKYGGGGGGGAGRGRNQQKQEVMDLLDTNDDVDTDGKIKADQDAMDAYRKARQFKADFRFKCDTLAQIYSLAGLSGGDGSVVSAKQPGNSSIENVWLAKSNAKKDWFLRDQDLDGLFPTKVGRSVKYKLTELIHASEIRHCQAAAAAGTTTIASFGCLKQKLLLGHNSERLRQYAYYLKSKLDKEYQDEQQRQSSLTEKKRVMLMEEAMQEAKAHLVSKIHERQGEVKKAQEEVKRLEKLSKAFDECVPSTSAKRAAAAATTANKENEKDSIVSSSSGAPASARKRQKTSSSSTHKNEPVPEKKKETSPKHELPRGVFA